MAEKKVLTEDEAQEMLEQYYQRPLGVRVVEESATLRGNIGASVRL